MANYFQSYYQGKKFKECPGKAINAWAYDKAHEGYTDKQLQYHANLCNFLRDRGIDVSTFERPRNKNDCHSKINALNTILRKNGLDEEFYSEKTEE